MSQEKLESTPSWGFFHFYDGGGYVADLGYSTDTAAPVISNLREYGWIDRQTRAVLVEFTIYNPNTGYFSISTFYYEVLPTGYGNSFRRIDTLLLTSTQTGFYQFYLICQLLFIITVIFFVLREVYNIYRMRCSYFRDAWNLVEISQITFSFLVVIFYVIKSKLFLKSALKVKENPYVAVSFGDVITWNDAENGVLAITVFIATIKLLRMIRFNPHISMLMSSFRASRGLLLSYSVIFIIIFLAYAQLGKLVLGNDLQSYSSFSNTLYSEFLMCLGGKMGLGDLLRVNRLLGPIFGFSFILLNTFIFVNFFVAILNDCYEEVKDNTDKQSKEFEMADFILQRLSELLGFGNHKREKEINGDESTKERTVHPVNNKNEVNPELEQQELEQKPNVSFSTLVFQSHRLRRMAKRKQIRNMKLWQENAKKKVKIDEEKCVVGESMTNKKKHQQKLVAPSMIAFDTSYQEQTFQKLDSLTSKVARDSVREDMEILSLIRLLRMCNEEGTQSTSPETDPALADIEISSFIASSSLSTYSACAEDGGSSTSGECSEDDIESLELLKNRMSYRVLPRHLKAGKELQEKLRATKAAKRTQPEKRKASGTTIFKYYSFI